MKTHLRKLWDSLKSSYWFIPFVMMTLALLLWFGTSSMDHTLSARDKKAVAWLYISDADTMRTLLLTIAATIIGVLGVVFSIIMIPLSIAAAQFGPRLLRTFLRDSGTQFTLGIYTSTFIFCMAVLLQLSNSIKQPLPQISVNTALLLALISFATLIYFINHVAVSLQAPVVVSRVSKELHTAIAHGLPDEPGAATYQPGPGKETQLPGMSSAYQVITAKESGYIQVRDDNSLLLLAQQHNIVLKLLNEPGDFIVQATPLVMVFGELNIETISEAAQAAFVTGVQRTLVQDVTFGINELIEVALRALSPAINDPFTAMTCLDWAGSALCQVCSRRFPEPYLYDNKGSLRIIRQPVTFTQLADAAFNQVREYGRGSSYVTLRIITTIKKVAGCSATAEQRSALLHHATLTESDCQTALPNAADRQAVTNEYETIKKILNSTLSGF